MDDYLAPILAGFINSIADPIINAYMGLPHLTTASLFGGFKSSWPDILGIPSRASITEIISSITIKNLHLRNDPFYGGNCL